MQNLNFTQALQIHDLSEVIAKGKEALKEASKIQKEYKPYLYKMVPVKVTYKDKIYGGKIAMSVIATLVGVPPYRIYQSLRRKGEWVFVNNAITVYVCNDINKLDFDGDNIKELLINK